MRKKKRQQYLYHGSKRKNIDMLVPKTTRGRKELGNVVYGTKHKSLAATFIPRTSLKNEPEISMIKGKPIVLIPNKKNFLKNDRGGAIYKIKNSPAFSKDLYAKNYQFGKFERISRRKIKPIDKKVYDSSIDAMVENGAIVYFVNKKQLYEYRKLIDNGMKPIEDKKLFGFFRKLTSENEKKGKIKKYWWRK